MDGSEPHGLDGQEQDLMSAATARRRSKTFHLITEEDYSSPSDLLEECQHRMEGAFLLTEPSNVTD